MVQRASENNRGTRASAITLQVNELRKPDYRLAPSSPARGRPCTDQSSVSPLRQPPGEEDGCTWPHLRTDVDKPYAAHTEQGKKCQQPKPPAHSTATSITRQGAGLATAPTEATPGRQCSRPSREIHVIPLLTSWCTFLSYSTMARQYPESAIRNINL